MKLNNREQAWKNRKYNDDDFKIKENLKKDLRIWRQLTFGAKNILQNVKNSIKSLVELGGYFAVYQL